MKKIILTILLFILLISLQSALAEISVDFDIPSEFAVGEKLYFNYSVTSSEGGLIEFYASILCQGFDKFSSTIIGEYITNNSAFYGSHSVFEINKSMENRECKAFLFFFQPIKGEISENFSVHVKYPLNIKICNDQSCKTESISFIKSSVVFLDYSTDIQDAKIESTLIFPDKTEKKLSLPESITANQVGIYDIVSKALRDGSEIASRNLNFVVVEERVELLYLDECNANAICDNSETIQNCPQDCALERKPKEEKKIGVRNLPTIPKLEKQLVKTNILLTSILIILAIGIIVFIVSKFYPSKKRK